MTHITIEKAKLEQALSALKRMASFGNTFGYRSSEQNPYEQVCEAIIAIKQDLALDKMAENARELGLDYEPVDGTQVSKVWWDGEKLMAKPIPLEDFYLPSPVQPVQEPVGVFVEDDDIGHVRLNPHLQLKLKDGDKLYTTPPAAQRQSARSAWVGLTPDDIRQLEKENTVGGLHGDYCPTWDLIESVEAKLKEKNNG
jgi:hypothetical protein